MASLDHSIDAKNILAKFYRVDKMLYVEGDDDVPFWEFMFERFDAPNVEVQQVGGKEELKKHIDQLISGELDAVVAMDSDLSIFEDTAPNHPNVLMTAGYSIENTLITAKVLMKIVRQVGRLPAKNATTEECQTWLDGFSKTCSKMVINDILDQCGGEKVGVIGTNCDRFFESKTSDKLCIHKIQNYLTQLGFDTDSELTEQIVIAQEAAGLDLADFIRGHFLASGAHRFVCISIQRKRAKISFSSAAFFGSLTLAFESSFDDVHPHYGHYERQFERLSASA